MQAELVRDPKAAAPEWWKWNSDRVRRPIHGHSGNLPVRNLAAALLYFILVIKNTLLHEAGCSTAVPGKSRSSLQRNNAKIHITDVSVRL